MSPNYVTLTEAAAREVKNELVKTGHKYLRLTMKGSMETGLVHDLQVVDAMDPKEDWLGESHGVKIVVDKRSALFVEGVTIDWIGTGFSINNPNAGKRE